jgi:hypothetical protein
MFQQLLLERPKGITRTNRDEVRREEIVGGDFPVRGRRGLQVTRSPQRWGGHGKEESLKENWRLMRTTGLKMVP